MNEGAEIDENAPDVFQDMDEVAINDNYFPPAVSRSSMRQYGPSTSNKPTRKKYPKQTTRFSEVDSAQPAPWSKSVKEEDRIPINRDEDGRFNPQAFVSVPASYPLESGTQSKSGKNSSKEIRTIIEQQRIESPRRMNAKWSGEEYRTKMPTIDERDKFNTTSNVNIAPPPKRSTWNKLFGQSSSTRSVRAGGRKSRKSRKSKKSRKSRKSKKSKKSKKSRKSKKSKKSRKSKF